MKSPPRRRTNDPAQAPGSNVTALTRLRAYLGARRAQQITWRAIAGEFPGVPPGTLCAIYKTGYVPQQKKIRRALGLIGKPSASLQDRIDRELGFEYDAWKRASRDAIDALLLEVL